MAAVTVAKKYALRFPSSSTVYMPDCLTYRSIAFGRKLLLEHMRNSRITGAPVRREVEALQAVPTPGSLLAPLLRDPQVPPYVQTILYPRSHL